MSCSWLPRVQRLRRALAALALLASAAALLLYWRQVGDADLAYYRRDAGQRNVLRTSEPLWSWGCDSGRCVREAASPDRPAQSLPTCNMLCESTQLWPQPTGPVSLASGALHIALHDLQLHVVRASEPVAELLQQAFQLLRRDIAAAAAAATGLPLPSDVSAVAVRVSINGTGGDQLRLDTDESYTLALRPLDDALVADIAAHSFYGARHALETLSQLIWLDPYAGGGTLTILKAASVRDAPRFPYRGLLLDTARNFFPVSDILRTVDAMGASKLNTFHWHITDSQSFPLRLNSLPKFADHGAYGPDSVYTEEDVRAVVKRARARGVRVLLEIDAPAHVGKSWSWGPEEGLGELAYCVEREPWQLYCGEPPCGQLNPRNPHVYDLLERIYAKIIELTGVSDVFHLGGDEVSEHCWASHFNDSDPMSLWLDFTEEALRRLRKANGGSLPEAVMLWSSRLTKSPYLERLDARSTVVQVWGASHWPESEAVGRAGYRSVVSHVDAWYLDCGFGSWRDNSDGHCGPYRSWQQVYAHRPWANDPEGARLVLGGEACQWTEQLDARGLDARVWPRAAALAERLWTDPASRARADTYARLQTHAERLGARGLRPAPLWPRWCADNPGACLDSLM